jgi:AAA domain
MKLQTFSALAHSHLSVDWLVEELISPGGWTFLIGDPKVGKSIWTIQLCDALQKGADFLGMKTSQRNCLYLQSDAGTIEWYKQVRDIAGDSYAWEAHEMEPGFLDEEYERKRLHEIVWGDYSVEVQGERGCAALQAGLEGKAFTFVVFDCLHTITNGDINTKTACNQVRAWINQIVTRRSIDSTGESHLEQVPYLLIHHPNAVQKQGTTAGAGWKGLSGDCTTKLSLLPGLLILEGSKISGKREILLERGAYGKWTLPQRGSPLETSLEAFIEQFSLGD